MELIIQTNHIPLNHRKLMNFIFDSYLWFLWIPQTDIFPAKILHIMIIWTKLFEILSIIRPF